MRKYYISLIGLLISNLVFAQWQPNGATTGNIYYNNGNVGVAGSFTSGLLSALGNSPYQTNLIMSANYPNSYRWRMKTFDRGNAIDLDFTASDNNDVEETVLQLTRSTSGRPSFSVMSNGLVVNNGKVGIGTTNPYYGKFQVTQVSDASDQGIAILNSTGGRAMRMWTDANNSYVYSNGIGTSPLILNNGGNVGIGTSHPDYPLTVNGGIHAKEVRVDLSITGPDYVFEQDYKLPSLEEIKTYIDENKHLPEIPSAKEMEKNGVQLGEMNMLLLKKIEELTLYVIEQNKKILEQSEDLKLQSERILKLESSNKD